MRRTPRWGATSKWNDKHLPAWGKKRRGRWLEGNRESLCLTPFLVSASPRAATMAKYWITHFVFTVLPSPDSLLWVSRNDWIKKKEKYHSKEHYKKSCATKYKETNITSWTCNLKNYILSGWIFFHTENVLLSSQNVYRYVKTFVISMDWFSRSVGVNNNTFVSGHKGPFWSVKLSLL